MTREIEAAIKATVIQMLHYYPFYGHLLQRMKWYDASNRISTFATNTYNGMYYNKDFFLNLKE